MASEAYEKLGAFYLGRNADTGTPFLYDANHLTTHGVVIGMTGSGKTGISIDLLEEAAIDGVPAIVVDPKGDLGNLLLTFPGLSAEEFAPWVAEGVDPAAEAERWRAGLASWEQDGERIRRLREAADIRLYTPGSRVGTPLSIVGSLAAPADPGDAEMLAERATQVATSLLGLVGVTAEPGQSKEHVFLATLLHKAWENGESLDLPTLVGRIQDPPFDKIGVLSLDSFYPAKERFQLAVAYNSMLAAPGFDAWTAGEPLDVGALLRSKTGKPQISILSIAHLDDTQRMFFVSLLLGQLVAWMRRQTGTSSLRALFFMDEVVGYFPPVAMPPSKRPLLLLLKQARAFGLGVVLATQNPVDLDYKGLSNTGTWIIGRLQTERDKARVLDGLEGASGAGFDRGVIEKVLSGLAKRHFYVHDVHASGPALVESRWTLSYLRGPLSRDEIKRLSPAAPPAAPATPTSGAPATTPNGTVLMVPGPPPPPAPIVAAAPSAPAGARPVLPPDVPEVFLPFGGRGAPLYAPFLLGAARVHFAAARTNLDFSREVSFLVRVVDGPLSLDWEQAQWAGLDLRAISREPLAGARFAPAPSELLLAKSYPKYNRDFLAWLARTQGIARWKVQGGKTFSLPNEDERAFRARLAQAHRETRDDKTNGVRAKFVEKFARLDDKIRAARDAMAQSEAAANEDRVQSALDLGGGMLGAWLRGSASGAVSSAKRAAKSQVRAQSRAAKSDRQREKLNELLARRAELEREAHAAMTSATGDADPNTMPLEIVVDKPKKTDITVHVVALAWAPVGLA